MKDRHAQCTNDTSHETDTVRGTTRRTQTLFAIISVTIQLWIKVS